MKRPINLEKVKRTRAELKALVKEHPELCHGEGNWVDNLEELKDMVMTPGKDRMAQYRARQQKKGLKSVNVYLSPEAQKVLAKLMEENPDATMGEIISAVLTREEK